MAQTLTTFDMAELLDSDETISEYLSQVLADGDNEEFLRANRLRGKSPRDDTDCRRSRRRSRKPLQGIFPRCKTLF